MTNSSSSHLGFEVLSARSLTKNKNGLHRTEHLPRKLAILVVAALLAPLVIAQGAPRVTGVDPSSGKVNDSVTLTGENLGKETVVAFFLSDDKTDFKATVVEQSTEKTVIKIPDVKPGNYNVSMQVTNRILIGPVKFKVTE
jgi:hypothetical protein